ncbi:MAG: hypothetical protein A2Y63_01125 [Candidatus Riflebacteria bacterium RBG_13_59_9]|nr:MAG: hypothetical protein A2Y63_01125 [Candidatus Riflebacteria bacterium RBG_13_59_9]
MMIKSRTGFTLVEMLVVVGIIGILITIMVPMIGRARLKALEGVVQANCASIQTALANYAATHDGGYPGAAMDVMAPYPDFALGGPVPLVGDPLYTAPDNPVPGGFAHGVLGGTGCFNPSTLPVRQQLKQVKDTVLDTSTTGTYRWFDSLILADALQEYPQNPFKRSGNSDANRMMNVFCFEEQLPGSTNDLTGFAPYILANSVENIPAGVFPDPRFSGRLQITLNFDALFGNDPDSTGLVLNAAGDFAYVPVLSKSAAQYADNPMTPEDDRCRWGTNVSGYLLFGFGHSSSRLNKYQDEKTEFGHTGLPGFGADFGGPTDAPACDTLYEQAVYALFDPAIYFSSVP